MKKTSNKPISRKGGTIAVAWGRYGGFGWYSGYTKRICLGWIAFYYFPEEIEDILNDLTTPQQ